MQSSPSDGLDRWVAAGTISDEQARRIRALGAPARSSLLAEGLGYFGGVVTLVGLVLAISLAWSDLTPAGRLGTATGVTAAVLAAGFAIPVGRLGPSGVRLRGALWLLGVAAVGLTLSVLLGDVLRWELTERAVLTMAGGASVAAVVLWSLNRHPLQQLAAIAAISTAVAAAAVLVSPSFFSAALGVWGTGVAWLVLGMAGVLPRGAVFGALGATVGGVMLVVNATGTLIALGTVLVLVALGVVRRDLGVLGIGSVGTLIVLPYAVNEYVDNVLVTALALVVTGLVLVAVGVATARRRPGSRPAVATGPAAWLAAGIITPEQAAAIQADLAATHPRGSLVAEGLGYAGGVIALAGLGLVIGLGWDDLSVGAQVGLAGAITAAFVGAGFLVPAARLGAAGLRLRGALWLLAAGGASLTAGLAADGLFDLAETPTLLAASGAALLVSAVLWPRNRHVLQHLSTVASLAVLAFQAASYATYAPAAGLAVWAVGAGWLVLSLTGVVARRGGGVLGSLTLVIGALLVIDQQWGPAFAIATVVALMVVGVLRGDLPALGVASVGTLIVLPFVVDRYLDGQSLTTALALIGAGLALVATGVVTAARRPAVT